MLSAPLLIVFCGGANLILIQWVLVREMTALLLGTELVTLLVTISYFLGVSLGYAVSHRLRPRWLPVLAVLTLMLHLSLPVWFRVLVTGLNAVGWYGAAYVLLPLVVPFVVSSFYSVFLPLYADRDGTLGTLYAAELLGAACGIAILFMLGGLGIQVIFALYTLGLLAILLALRLRPALLIGLTAACIAWLAALPGVNTWSNTLWYQQTHGLPTPLTTVFTGYSAYQKIDVLRGPRGELYLYLDGLHHFGGRDGSRLNVILGYIPGILIRPHKALVIGAGSMEMEAMIARNAGEVTTVELDPMVVNVSRRYFDTINHLSTLANRQIIVDDAKHFLAQGESPMTEMYDLISTDTPAAYSLQTATLYSAPFYQAIAARLAPGGVLAANLTSRFTPEDVVSRRIAASLLTAFDEVIVVTAASAGWSFAYASDDLPFDRVHLEAALRSTGETEFILYDTAAVRAVVGAAQPITLDSMDIVLAISWEWISDR